MEDSNNSGSYWSTTLLGGVIVPLGTMTDSHRRSLAAGLRVGWTSRVGLGVDVIGGYSPVSRSDIADGQRADSHLIGGMVMPRFTLGRGSVRAWVAAGAGLAFQRTNVVAGTETVATSNDVAMSADAALAVELHPISGVGLALVSSYHRGLIGEPFEFVNLTAGLTFTFQ